MNATEAAYAAFCTQRFPNPSEKQVAALEERLGAALPPDYRRFILQFNGGYFSEPEIVAADEDCPRDRLNSLWGIGALYKFAELGHDTDIFDDNSPTMLLPIGYTLLGNLLLTVTRKDEDYGCIFLKRAYAWDFYCLSETIDGFFELLRPTNTGVIV